MPINRSGALCGLAERRAVDVSHGRQQLGNGRDTLERYRNSELAEAEASALARIKADAQRALAHQAQALRDAERAAELVAIERRSNDLVAIKSAQRREALDQEAAVAASATARAALHAEQTARDKQSALVRADQARQARLAAEREAIAAQRNGRLARIGLAWMAFRGTSPIVAGVLALLLGATGGWLFAELHHTKQYSPREEAPLRLETQLAVMPIVR